MRIPEFKFGTICPWCGSFYNAGISHDCINFNAGFPTEAIVNINMPVNEIAQIAHSLQQIAESFR